MGRWVSSSEHEIILKHTNDDCLNDISSQFHRSANWRECQAARFPSDIRNALAAAKLKELADSADIIPDDVWQELQPHYNPNDHRWLEAVTRLTREVVFRRNPKTFHSFLDSLIADLSQTRH